MKQENKTNKYHLKDFYILWSTQSISQFGSSITAFALTLWLYEKTGSSLSTAALTICSYAPYVLMSIFAGALRWHLLHCGFLKKNPMIMTLILFMSGVKLIASAFDATLPGYVLPKPKDRVKIVYLTMLFSLGSENFLLAFSREPVLWYLGQIIGWILVPVMSANLDVILRSSIPVELQGRVYACRNTLQFFTIYRKKIETVSL